MRLQKKSSIMTQHASQSAQPIQQTRRGVFLAAIPIVIGLGLMSRSAAADWLPGSVALYSGDMLWALLVYCVVGVVWPAWSARELVAASLLLTFLLESSQLYRAPWLNALRATRLGGLILGYSFLWSDLACYTVGIGIGYGFDTRWRRKREVSSDTSELKLRTRGWAGTARDGNPTHTRKDAVCLKVRLFLRCSWRDPAESQP